MRIKISAILIFLLVFVLAGCSHTQKPAAQSVQASKSGTETTQVKSNGPLLYQNQKVGLKISQTAAWKKTSEKMSSKGLNVVFKEDGLHAIVSVVPAANSIKAVQADLLKSVSHPTILSQTDSLLDFQAGTKDKIRVLSYLKKKENQDYIFSFVTPLKTFDQKKPVIQKFMDNVQIK